MKRRRASDAEAAWGPGLTAYLVFGGLALLLVGFAIGWAREHPALAAIAAVGALAIVISAWWRFGGRYEVTSRGLVVSERGRTRVVPWTDMRSVRKDEPRHRAPARWTVRGRRGPLLAFTDYTRDAHGLALRIQKAIHAARDLRRSLR